MEDCSRGTLKILVEQLRACVLAIDCAALVEGLLISGPQFPHVSNKNNNSRL